MTPVEQVRSICRERGIAVSQLERECGFSNGYLNPKKLHKLPYDRAVRVAEYLDLPVQSAAQLHGFLVCHPAYLFRGSRGRNP